MKRLTPKIRSRLEEVVDLKLITPTHKELERETGLSALYIAQLLSQIRRAKLKSMTIHVEQNDAKIVSPSLGIAPHG